MFFVLFFGIIYSRTIKIATLAPKKSLWGHTLTSIKNDLKKTSGIKLKIYFGGRMGDENVMVSRIKIGQIGGGAFTGRGLGIISGETRVLELPFLFSDKKQIKYVYKKIEKDLDKYYLKNNFKLIALIDAGNAYIFSKRNISDFKSFYKMKMWVWKGDSLAHEFAKQLKIKIFPINFTEVLPSLETGIIDSFYSTPTGAVSLQWFLNTKYILYLQIVTVSSGLVLSKKEWKKLKQNEKQQFVNITKKYFNVLSKNISIQDSKSVSILKNKYNFKIIKNYFKKDYLLKIKKKVNNSLIDKLYSNEIYLKLVKYINMFKKEK